MAVLSNVLAKLFGRDAGILFQTFLITSQSAPTLPQLSCPVTKGDKSTKCWRSLEIGIVSARGEGKPLILMDLIHLLIHLLLIHSAHLY